VLLDIMMPEMDGWDVFRQMRLNARLANVPVIVMTARASEVDRLYGETVARVNAFLSKPFSAQELREAVSQVLAMPASAE
jgi:CheY-like chemotaxis protein